MIDGLGETMEERVVNATSGAPFVATLPPRLHVVVSAPTPPRGKLARLAYVMHPIGPVFAAYATCRSFQPREGNSAPPAPGWSLDELHRAPSPSCLTDVSE
jgi:hypothetical protein